MKRYTLSALAIASLVLSSNTANAAITVEVVPSSAPNFFGSPNWAGYLANANNSLKNTTGTSIGDRSTDPTAYEAYADGQEIKPGEIIVSSFSSWRGEAGAAAPFDAENGNRLHFGTRIYGDGAMQFRGADINGEITSSDGNVLGFATAITSGSYTSTRIGINWGPDRVKGGTDDVVYTSGSDSLIIDEFIYVGVGNAYDASFEVGPTDQEKLDQVVASISPDFPINVTGIYTVLDPTGTTTLATGSSSVSVVPEPGTIALLGIAGMGVACVRRRRSC